MEFELHKKYPFHSTKRVLIHCPRCVTYPSRLYREPLIASNFGYTLVSLRTVSQNPSRPTAASLTQPPPFPSQGRRRGRCEQRRRQEQVLPLVRDQVPRGVGQVLLRVRHPPHVFLMEGEFNHKSKIKSCA